MSPRTSACSIWVNLRSSMTPPPVPPNMLMTQDSAADVGNWITALGASPSMLQSTIAVVAGSEAAYSS